MDEKRYTMAEAAELLDVSNKTLVNWVNVGGLRKTVDTQVFEYDKRAHYLTYDQLMKLARDHRIGAEVEARIQQKHVIATYFERREKRLSDRFNEYKKLEAEGKLPLTPEEIASLEALLKRLKE